MEKEHLSSQKDNVKVVPREDIPAITSVFVEGEEHNLGILKDFRRQTDLARFIPEDGRFSISWVHLKKGEVLSPHKHPTKSMIVICEGTGELIGDRQEKLKAGDVAIVPPNCVHGFVGRGNEGFWAFSVQFEGTGLYENQDRPRVRFMGEGKAEDRYERLEKIQKKYEKRFLSNPLMKLLDSDSIKQKETQERLLEALNFWSDWFQRILAARVAIEEPKIFQEAAEEHFAEEVGHNKSLLNLRKNMPVLMWDPLLDASASWFYHKILTGTPEEKAILMHCVLESASYIFHTKAKETFSDMPHFALHSDLDTGHAQMGFDLLKAVPDLDDHKLAVTLDHGWRMFEHLCTRMAAYAKKGKSK